MEKKQIYLEFTRGDSFEKGFLLKRGDMPVLTDFIDVYFTVKKHHSDHDFIFQKRMSNGGIINDEDGHYTLYIDPEDTNNMGFGEYDCDIEFRGNDNYKRTFYGKLKLNREVTHYYNE